MPDNTGKKQGKTQFPKGHSGNPNGRPKGTRNKSTILVQLLLERDLEEICNRVIEEAKAGNMQAVKMILDRILPPKKDSPIAIDIPEIKTSSDILQAINCISTAVGQGEISPSEGETLSKIIDIHSKALEIYDFEKRLKAIEERGSK
jgi:hypothetical protein